MNKAMRDGFKVLLCALGLDGWVTRRTLSREHAIIQGTFHPSGQSKSILLYTTTKCASTVTHRIVNSLALRKDPEYVHANLFRYFYNVGIKPDDYFPQHIDQLLLPRGVVYGPLRRGVTPSNAEDYDIIIILRDPRDVLVSDYYSMRESHPLPMNTKTRERLTKERTQSQNESIDEHALRRAAEFISYYRSLVDMAGKPNTLFLTYEQFVLHFDTFLNTLLDWLDISLTDEERRKLAELAGTTKPTLEDPSKHIRKRTPGDYQNKLSDATVRILDKQFNFYFTFLKATEGTPEHVSKQNAS